MTNGNFVQAGVTGSAPRGPAVLAKGFRPIFLMAGAQAASSMILWLLVLHGRAAVGAYFPVTYWHAHEMVFGFAVAVVAGFLLTAVANWTGRETVVGAPLGGLALLWLAGRLAVIWAADLPRGGAALLDLAFLPALALGCARPILLTANRRNYQFVGMLAALFLANLAMHLGAMGIAPAWIRRGAWVGVDILILMILVMTARILPMFTRNATGAEGIRNLPGLDRIAAGGGVLLVLCDTLGTDERVAAMVGLLTGITVALRSSTWGGRQSLRHPLLWVLHAGHSLVALGLVLRALPFYVPGLAPSAALHALTAGGIGMLTLGMMARVSLGHSGRPLQVGRPMSMAFALAGASAVLRVFGPLAAPHAYLPVMLLAGGGFALAFGTFLVVYLPILTSPRVDGRPG